MTTQNSSLKEPSLLEMYLLMCQRKHRLGGSKKFHDRISKSLSQDDDTFGMLDYAKKSGILMNKSRLPNSLRNKKKVALSDNEINNIGLFSRPNTPDGSTSVVSSMRHSSMCDVIGPDVCEECRRNGKQLRFVENSLLRPTISLPDIYRPKFADVIQVNTSNETREKRRRQRKILTLPSVQRKALPKSKHPITVVEEAQKQNKVVKTERKGDDKSGRLTPIIGPISKDGEMTQDQLYRRVINNHRKKLKSDENQTTPR